MFGSRFSQLSKEGVHNVPNHFIRLWKQRFIGGWDRSIDRERIHKLSTLIAMDRVGTYTNYYDSHGENWASWIIGASLLMSACAASPINTAHADSKTHIAHPSPTPTTVNSTELFEEDVSSIEALPEYTR